MLEGVLAPFENLGTGVWREDCYFRQTTHSLSLFLSWIICSDNSSGQLKEMILERALHVGIPQ